MKYLITPLFFALCCLSLTHPASAQQPAVDFDGFFYPAQLRVDYFMAGDSASETVFLKGIRKEPKWSGSGKTLIDPFNTGSFRYELVDSATGTLIFARGFCNLFQEWRLTSEALKMKKAFEQVAVMPFPKKTAYFRVLKRNYSDGLFSLLFQTVIDPMDYFIYSPNPVAIPFTKFLDNGDPAKKVDIAFIAEGYLPEEMPKFLLDARRIGDYFLKVSPFAEYPGNFNFYAIQSPSAESGVTIPGTREYVNTSVKSTFYTFNMDRYLTCFNTFDVYDLAATVPYDAIFILVNSKRYGGGGFFNHLGESTVDNPLSNIVAVHEFGHTFAGLADEYYTSEVTYTGFYNLAVEPWEPNITTNVDFDSKWKKMIKPGIPVPTPRTDEYRDEVGLFEGGGYVGKGIFSPKMDCRMKSNEAAGFCPVCREAIRRMILFYSE